LLSFFIVFDYESKSIWLMKGKKLYDAEGGDFGSEGDK
jgi:hypothetical protein